MTRGEGRRSPQNVGLAGKRQSKKTPQSKFKRSRQDGPPFTRGEKKNFATHVSPPRGRNRKDRAGREATGVKKGI